MAILTNWRNMMSEKTSWLRPSEHRYCQTKPEDCERGAPKVRVNSLLGDGFVDVRHREPTPEEDEDNLHKVGYDPSDASNDSHTEEHKKIIFAPLPGPR